MNDYLNINKKAYNSLAEEYLSKWDVRAYVLGATMGTFVRSLRREFKSKNIRVLDVGCGVGKRAYFLSKRGLHGYRHRLCGKRNRICKKESSRRFLHQLRVHEVET